MFEPIDAFDQELIQQAAPPHWKNPQPAGSYNLLAVGGGTAGIIAALGCAGLGGRAALVERKLLGGDCLNFGCVPSKALLRTARAVGQVQAAIDLGCRLGSSDAAVARDAREAPSGPRPTPPEVSVDFAAVMERMRRLRARISHHDSAERFTRLGADVYLGSARFTGRDRLEVAGQTLPFRRAVIAVGGSPTVPDVPGLREAGYLTNETVFSLTRLPRRLLVIGAGPIGCELAQAFRRFGSEVWLVNRSPTLLKKEDPLAAELVQRQLVADGLQLRLGWSLEECRATADGQKQLRIRRGEAVETLLGDEILVAAGRQPNLDELGLEAAGVRYSARGVEVDDFLRTSNRNIYAAGDCLGQQLFTHAADAMARICIQNALFFGRKRLSRLVIPRCTYTSPELAHVGLTPREAAERNVPLASFRVDLSEVDRAILDGEEAGLALVHVHPRTGRVAGATIVAENAGDLIAEITLLMTAGWPLHKLADAVHCYPTQGEVLKKVADRYNRTRLTPRVAWLLRTLLAWRR